MVFLQKSIFFSVPGALLFLCSLDVWAEDSLCQKQENEKIIFNCLVEGKPKILSVCLSRKKPGSNAGYIKYRFGTRERVELEYPVEYPERANNNFSAFRYSEEMRRSLVQTLSFTMGEGATNGTTYTVFAGQRPLETSEPRFFGGVRVQQGSAATAKDLACRAAPTNHLDELKNLVPQDQ